MSGAEEGGSGWGVLCGPDINCMVIIKPAQRPGHLERPQVDSNNQIRALIAAAADGGDSGADCTASRHGGG